MIYYTNKDFKHSFNIEIIIKNLDIFEQLKDINYYFAGGFPAALLLAPRSNENPDRIEPKYFSDIDLFFPTEEDFKKAQGILSNNCNNNLGIQADTENAITYIYYKDSIGYNIQLVRKMFLTEEELINTFDIVNCGITYNYNKKQWISHALFLQSNLNKKLTFHNPVMLNEDYPDYPNTIFFQLERIAKYCERYDLDLDPNAMLLLLEHNKKYPNLDYRKNTTLLCRGYYSTYSRNIEKTFNVWAAFSHIFKENGQWEYFSKHFQNITDQKKEQIDEIVIPF